MLAYYDEIKMEGLVRRLELRGHQHKKWQADSFSWTAVRPANGLGWNGFNGLGFDMDYVWVDSNGLY